MVASFFGGQQDFESGYSCEFRIYAIYCSSAGQSGSENGLFCVSRGDMATMTSCVIAYDRALSTGHHFARRIFFENDDLGHWRVRETAKETFCVKSDRDPEMNRDGGNFYCEICFACVF